MADVTGSDGSTPDGSAVVYDRLAQQLLNGIEVETKEEEESEQVEGISDGAGLGIKLDEGNAVLMDPDAVIQGIQAEELEDEMKEPEDLGPGFNPTVTQWMNERAREAEATGNVL